MFGWFKKKSRKSELEEEKSRQLLEWKHKFFDVLTILADMFPDGMAMLLEELDIHHPPSYDKTEWYLSIWNNHNYILQNIHRLPRLNVRRGILTGFEVPVPDVVLNKVTMLLDILPYLKERDSGVTGSSLECRSYASSPQSRCPDS